MNGGIHPFCFLEIYGSRCYINDSWRSLLLLVITLFVKIHRSYVINSKKFLLEVYFINIAYSDAPRIFENSNVPNILKVSEEFQIFQKFRKYIQILSIFEKRANIPRIYKFPTKYFNEIFLFSGNCTKFSRIFQIIPKFPNKRQNSSQVRNCSLPCCDCTSCLRRRARNDRRNSWTR